MKHSAAPKNSAGISIQHTLRGTLRQRVGRTAFGVACFASGLALSLSAATHFGFLSDRFAIELGEKLLSIHPAASIFKIKSKTSENPETNQSQNDSPFWGSELKEANLEIGETPQVAFDRERVLDDYDHRISDEFSIPKGLRDRVGFWFDVYTKYDSNHRIIHHSRYPWIVYKVVDVTSIINSDTPKRRWMRNQKADDLVKAEAEKIRAAIRNVARGKSNKKLKEYEDLVTAALSKLDGSLKKQASFANGNTRVQVGQKDFFAEGLEVSPRYLTAMEEIFREKRLPVELTRIPFVESSFNKHATSKVGATGIWQFMGPTGRKFMVVNDHIDERRSPFKATEAAARLLKENHMILHRSWPLAVTAWNHGPPGIRKAMRAAGTKDLATIISRYRSKSFDFASSNFYSEFLGALHAQVYNKEIFGDIPREGAWTVHEVRLAKSVAIKEVIRKSGLTTDEFVQFNPDLTRAIERNVRLPVGFRLMVTSEARSGLDRILAANSLDRRRAQLDTDKAIN